ARGRKGGLPGRVLFSGEPAVLPAHEGPVDGSGQREGGELKDDGAWIASGGQPGADRSWEGPEGLEVGRVDPAEAKGGPGDRRGEQRGEDERRGEPGVEDDGDAEEEGLVDVAEHGDDPGPSHRAELCRAAAEQEQAEGERRAGAALPDEPQVEVERRDVRRRD